MRIGTERARTRTRDGAGRGDTVRLSEILGALSHALDLTEGQPPGHCVRATWIGMQGRPARWGSRARGSGISTTP